MAERLKLGDVLLKIVLVKMLTVERPWVDGGIIFTTLENYFCIIYSSGTFLHPMAKQFHP